MRWILVYCKANICVSAYTHKAVEKFDSIKPEIVFNVHKEKRNAYELYYKPQQSLSQWMKVSFFFK